MQHPTHTKAVLKYTEQGSKLTRYRSNFNFSEITTEAKFDTFSLQKEEGCLVKHSILYLPFSK